MGKTQLMEPMQSSKEVFENLFVIFITEQFLGFPDLYQMGRLVRMRNMQLSFTLHFFCWLFAMEADDESNRYFMAVIHAKKKTWHLIAVYFFMVHYQL